MALPRMVDDFYRAQKAAAAAAQGLCKAGPLTVSSEASNNSVNSHL